MFKKTKNKTPKKNTIIIEPLKKRKRKDHHKPHKNKKHLKKNINHWPTPSPFGLPKPYDATLRNRSWWTPPRRSNIMMRVLGLFEERRMGCFGSCCCFLVFFGVFFFGGFFLFSGCFCVVCGILVVFGCFWMFLVVFCGLFVLWSFLSVSLDLSQF